MVQVSIEGAIILLQVLGNDIEKALGTLEAGDLLDEHIVSLVRERFIQRVTEAIKVEAK